MEDAIFSTELDDNKPVKPKAHGWMQAEGRSAALDTLGNGCLALCGETEEGKAAIPCLENGIKPRTSPFCL